MHPNLYCRDAFKKNNQLETYFFTLHVLTPKMVYNGQKLIKLVSTKIPAKANKMYAKVPSTILK